MTSLRSGQERARAAVVALGLIGMRAAVLGPCGQLIAWNKGFSSLQPGLVRDEAERIVLANSALDASFVSALKTLRSDLDTRDVHSMASPSKGRFPPLVFHLVPIRRGRRDMLGGSGLLLALPVEHRGAPSEQVLQMLYDLTPAEARVARGIASSEKIATIAANLGVSTETVRTQVKAILGKTGVNRQAELVALLSGLALKS